MTVSAGFRRDGGAVSPDGVLKDPFVTLDATKDPVITFGSGVAR